MLCGHSPLRQVHMCLYCSCPDDSTAGRFIHLSAVSRLFIHVSAVSRLFIHVSSVFRRICTGWGALDLRCIAAVSRLGGSDSDPCGPSVAPPSVAAQHRRGRRLASLAEETRWVVTKNFASALWRALCQRRMPSRAT